MRKRNKWHYVQAVHMATVLTHGYSATEHKDAREWAEHNRANTNLPEEFYRQKSMLSGLLKVYCRPPGRRNVKLDLDSIAIRDNYGASRSLSMLLVASSLYGPFQSLGDWFLPFLNSIKFSADLNSLSLRGNRKKTGFLWHKLCIPPSCG